MRKTITEIINYTKIFETNKKTCENRLKSWEQKAFPLVINTLEKIKEDLVLNYPLIENSLNVIYDLDSPISGVSFKYSNFSFTDYSPRIIGFSIKFLVQPNCKVDVLVLDTHEESLSEEGIDNVIPLNIGTIEPAYITEEEVIDLFARAMELFSCSNFF